MRITARFASIFLMTISVGGCGGSGDVLRDFDAGDIKKGVEQVCGYRVQFETVLEILAIIDPTRVAAISQSVGNRVIKKICEKAEARGPQSSRTPTLRVKNPQTGRFVEVELKQDPLVAN